MGQDLRPDDAGADALDASALEEVSGGCASASDDPAVGTPRPKVVEWESLVRR